jgi:PAS domain S-box-containing protein
MQAFSGDMVPDEISDPHGPTQVSKLARQLLQAMGGGEPGSAGLLAFEAGLTLAQDYGGAFPFFWDRRQPEALASTGFRDLFGLPRTAPLTNATLFSAIHRGDIDRIAALQQRLLSEGGHYDVEFRVRHPDGAVRWVLARGRTLADGSGRPCGTAGVHIDITERKLSELALARREAEVAANEVRLRTILNTMPQMVWSTLPDGHHDFYNDRWYEFTGVSRGDGDGDGWLDLVHPDDREGAMQKWLHSLASGEPYETEFRLLRHDGSYRWILGRALPIRDADGAIDRWFGSSTDIDDLKIAEEQLELIAGELAHRIRNIFAVVNSLLMLSSRGDSHDRAFADTARARIDALARAHDYVRPQTGHGGRRQVGKVTTHGLLQTLLAPYSDAADTREPGNRIVIEGQDLDIGTAAGTSLALVIHELATNAVKHGALSAETGRLHIRTALADGVARIRWEEVGGPSVHGAPERRGFGTTLSERALKVPLAGELSRDWRADGLVAEIRVPVERLSR